MSHLHDTHSDGISKDLYHAYETSSSKAQLTVSYEDIEPKLISKNGGTEPAAYRVGSATLKEPLVTIQYLEAHLSLLGAFKALRTTIEENIDAKLPSLVVSLDAPQRWAWFVGLAVDRFERWAAIVQPSNLATWVKEELPPLDVMMVWHAYMLNPRWYAEDCERLPIMKSLSGMGDRLLPAIQMGDPRSYHPPPERLSTWFTQTNMPFEPLEAARSMTHRTVKCPRCATELMTPYLNENGTGYAQQHFSVECTHCQSMLIKKETLALSKFLDDLVSDHEQAGKGLGAYLAGTLHTETESINVQRAQRIKTTIVQTGAFTPVIATRRGEWKQELLTRFNYSTAELPAAASRQMLYLGGQRMVNRIFSAYTDDRPFSVDLVGAVIRQGSFVDKMHEFGWTERGFFDDPEDQMVLTHVVARYHAFLDLMASTPAALFVPTLDVDLAWHTHQLMASQYASSCFKLMRRFIDHDDKVEENFLAASFDITCRAWEKRFQLPYMHCGCPVPGNTIGQRLNNLARVFKGKNKASHLAPPDRHDVLSATHPSEHNSVLIRGRDATSDLSLQRRKAREEKLEKLRKRDVEKVRQGKMDPGTLHKGNEHDYPFLSPVPLYDSTAVCVTVDRQLTCGAGVCAMGAGLCASGYAEGSDGAGKGGLGGMSACGAGSWLGASGSTMPLAAPIG